MNEVVAQLLGGDIDTVTLLLLFIVGILTKRFVPWWIHEDVVERLKKYEAVSPSLIESLNDLAELLDERDEDVVIRKARRLMIEKQKESHDELRTRPRTVPRTRKRTT